MQSAECQRDAILPVLEAFAIDGDLVSLDQWMDGHINLTYLARVARDERIEPYVIQKVNSKVFTDIKSLMDNAIRVSEHSAEKLISMPGVTPDQLERGAIKFKRTRSGEAGLLDESGDVWRLYPCIQRAKAFKVAMSPEEAYEAAWAFGLFQVLLSDLPGPRLNETLPRFHDTLWRFDNLENAATVNSHARADSVAGELEKMYKRRRQSGVLQKAHAEGKIPERIVHNDAKLSNVLLDTETRKAVCVIDLDTVMPGYSLHDFGDLVRSICSPAKEAEEDLSRIQVRLPYFEALVSGFLDSAGDMLTPGEIELLPDAGWVLTLEVAIRFMTDHLEGDRYFRIHHPGQNRVRAVSQFTLVERLEEAMPAMREIVRKKMPAKYR